MTTASRRAARHGHPRDEPNVHVLFRRSAAARAVTLLSFHSGGTIGHAAGRHTIVGDRLYGVAKTENGSDLVRAYEWSWR